MINNKQKSNQYERYGNIIINKSQPLGSGNFGHVYRGYLINPQNTQLQPVAIKQSYNETSNQNIKQIQTLQILHHPNIVRYRDYRIAGNSVFMVMELCEGGTLDDLLEEVYVGGEGDCGKLVGYFRQILTGIRFMYEKKILHRDIKPSNLLVGAGGVIKIADFGTSKMDRSSQIKLKTLVGTPLFFSPELFEMSFGEEDTYTEKSEIWALGLILYYMFNFDHTIKKPAERIKQSLPWSGKTTLEIFKNIKNQPLKFKKPNQIPQQIKQIITKMLKVNAQQRMSFQQLFDLPIFSPQSPQVPTCPTYPTQPTQPPQQKTITQTTRQSIDWQLLQLLQRKDQQHINNEQLSQYRSFYELLIAELDQVYEIKYYQIMFELEFMYFQLCGDQGVRGKLKEKYYERVGRFEEVEGKLVEGGVGNLGNNPSLVQNNSSVSNQIPQQILLPTPSQKLLHLSKSLIKDLLPSILPQPLSPPKSPKPPKPPKLPLQQKQSKNILYLIYDLFTLITLQKSWDIKRKTRATMGEYKKMRSMVQVGNILGRIRKAVECVKL